MTRLPNATELLSAALGRLATLPVPRAAAAFARVVGADLDEAERPVGEYRSVFDFFVRRLRPGARPLDSDPESLSSSVDGRVLALGPVGDGRLVQSKDRRYALAALLGDAELAGRFGSGSYVTVYLSPKDYHRIHAPCDVAILGARVLPGALWPVNAVGTRLVADVFPRNRRVVVDARSPTFGRLAIVMVGATNVGAIRATFDPDLTRSFDRPRRREYAPPLRVAKGDEIGVFELGSTVIVVTERCLRFTAQKPGDEVRVGRGLARRERSSTST